MIDLKRIENYRENNRIEAKKALGGLPKSIWETYSAFANTLGGVILLGVREDKDKSLHPVRLPNPERLLDEFWKIINDTSKVSANILTKKHVEIVGVGDSRFIAITVPRAARQDRPIYIGTDAYLGSYRRSGEGDYRCTIEEIKGMFRDASKTARDMRPIAVMDINAFEENSVAEYRRALLQIKPHTPLAALTKEAFLEKIGAAAKDEKGVLRPTNAGLLMLGKIEDIKERYPYYHVSFEERKNVRKTNEENVFDRCVGQNVFSFFTSVNGRILENLQNVDKDVQNAATEALTNCLVNADYYARGGIYVTYKRSEIVFSNPGGFRLSVEKAKTGGVSDPRNVGMLHLFQQIGVGSGTGSGIPGIFALWGKDGRGVPIIRESFHPDRVSVILPFVKSSGKRNVIKSKAGKQSFGEEEERAVIEFLTEKIRASISEICEALCLPSTDVKAILIELTNSGVLRQEKNLYMLKS